MATFKYTARAQTGNPINGTIDAKSPNDAASQLIKQGLSPIQILEKRASAGISASMDMQEIFPPKVTTADLIQLTRQFSSLTKAGVTMSAALKGMLPNMKHPVVAKVAKDILDNISAGQNLASAFGQHPKVFSPFYVSMIKIGEATGRLGEIFKQLTLYLDRENKTAKRVKSALRYPMFVLTAILIALVVITVYVVPGFSTMFARFNAELPLATRILLATSHIIMTFWPVLIGAVVGLVYGWKKYVKTEHGRYNWGKLQLRIPVASNVIRLSIMARFSRLLSIMMRAGIQIAPALTVVAEAIDNAYIQKRILSMRSGIERGEPVYNAAYAAGIFDDLVLQMLSVGQDTGSIDEMMEEVADYQDEELDYALEKLSAAIEPITMVIIGVLLLVLALGVFMPMWNLGSVAK